MNDLVRAWSDTKIHGAVLCERRFVARTSKKINRIFHLYDEYCVELLQFLLNIYKAISMQRFLKLSTFAHPHFDWNNPYESLIGLLDIIMGG